MEKLNSEIKHIQEFEDAEIVSDVGTKITITEEIEHIIDECLKRLDLKPSHKLLLKAFVEISDGEITFEASKVDLANLLYNFDQTDQTKFKKRVYNSIKSLLSWQRQNKVEFIRVTEKGRRNNTEDGKFEYIKTKYEFLLLRVIKQITQQNPGIDVDSILVKLLEAFEVKNKEKGKTEKGILIRKIQQSRTTILTKLKRIFNLNAEIGDNPVKSCKWVLRDARKLLKKMEADWKEQKNIEKALAEFEEIYE